MTFCSLFLRFAQRIGAARFPRSREARRRSIPGTRRHEELEPRILMTVSAAPAQLTVPQVTATATSPTNVDLSWTASAGTSGYLVYWIHGSSWNYEGTVGASQTSMQLSGMTAGATETFVVYAYDSAGYVFNTASILMPQLQVAAPQVSATATSQTTVNLSWTASAGTSGYLVYWIHGSTWNYEGSVGASQRSMQLSGMTAGAAETFVVYAYNSAGYAYGTAGLIMPQPQLAAPRATATATSPTDVNLSWTASAGTTGYLVYWVHGSTWNYEGSVDASQTAMQLTGMTAGANEMFVVYAYNSAGYVYGTTSVTMPYPQLTAPQVTATATSSTTVALSWTVSVGATEYDVYWNNGSHSTFEGSVGASQTSMQLSGMTAGAFQSFTVYAYSATSVAYGTAGVTMPQQQTSTWLDQYIQTDAIRTAVRSNVVGGLIGRDGMLNIFQTVIQSGTVTAQEFADLKALVGNTAFFVGQDYVQVLSNKVVNGDPGNARYQSLNSSGNVVSTTLGNLSAGSSSTQLSQLVNMWFLGVNEPIAGAAYSAASGSLYGTTGGPLYTDVRQGYVGDCWLLACLAEAAARKPSLITDMFTYNGTNVVNGQTVSVYTVRLFTSGTANYVTVDTELPLGGGYYDHPANGALWVALAEKAYAVLNGAGGVQTSHPNTNSYAALDSGDPAWALNAIDGNGAWDFIINPANAASALQAGKLVVFCTSNPSSQYIVPGHCYALVAYDSTAANGYEVYNPWGSNSAGWALGTYNGRQVYGHFTADATFISQNFAWYSTVGASTTATSIFSADEQLELVGAVTGGAIVVNGTAAQNPIVLTATGDSTVVEPRHETADRPRHDAEGRPESMPADIDAFFSSMASFSGMLLSGSPV